MLIAELNRTRRIGCEFEMAVPLVGRGGSEDVQEMLARVLTSNGLRAIARSYSPTPLPASADLAVEFDSSVRGESRYSGVQWFSIELKTRILNGIEDWERIVPPALDIARYMGARVNRSCGHHVHVDFPEANTKPTVIKSLYNLAHRFEPVWYGLVAPSRRSNGYAQPMPDRTRFLHGCRRITSFRRALSDWERRCGLNLTHVFEADPRVEFRYHHGTLDAEKARHWMRLLNRIVEHAVTRSCQAAQSQTPNTRKGLEALCYTIGLKSNIGIYAKVSPELKETSKFLLKRWQQFNESISGAVEGAAHEE